MAPRLNIFSVYRTSSLTQVLIYTVKYINKLEHPITLHSEE